MTRPRDYEQEQGRPRDDSDRAANLSPDDPEAQRADEPNGPDEEDGDLRIVGPEGIGGGSGLDEAELARADPLDGKPWNGGSSEPLRAAPVADEGYPSEDQHLGDEEGEEEEP